MAISKILPLDKTILTEFKIQVADIHRRSKYLVESIAVRVPQSGKFVSADATIALNAPLEIQAVASVIAIHSFVPISILLEDSTGSSIIVPCTGLFLVYGTFARVEIRSTAEFPTTRLTYLYA